MTSVRDETGSYVDTPRGDVSSVWTTFVFHFRRKAQSANYIETKLDVSFLTDDALSRAKSKCLPVLRFCAESDFVIGGRNVLSVSTISKNC